MCDMIGEVVDDAQIANQIDRQEYERTHEFNLMLVGLTGVGKSTLVKSLFDGDIKPEETDGEPKLNEYSDLLEQNGVKLRLRCVETSNFDSHDAKLYTNYIDARLKSHFVSERLQPWWKIKDQRVHCCLYMIQPYGKMRLRDEDLECMKALHERVNLVPIIAKADTFNSIQVAKFKENILSDLKAHNIKYYQFAFDEKEDEERSKVVRVEAARFPFAVVAADGPTYIDKKPRWIRETMSGHINILDKNYDFDALAKLLIRHCLANMIDTTQIKHYAKFKNELLEAARLNGPGVLEDLGLDQHEVARIFYDLSGSRLSLKELRDESEKQLQKLRNELQTIKLGVPKRSKPETPREKPSILREKPDFLRQLSQR